MSNSPYDTFDQEIITKTRDYIASIPERNLLLYNIDILTVAVLYIHLYTVTKENIKKFEKRTLLETRDVKINILDFIRYLKFLTVPEIQTTPPTQYFEFEDEDPLLFEEEFGSEELGSDFDDEY